MQRGRGREAARRGTRIDDGSVAGVLACGGTGERARRDGDAVSPSKQFLPLAGKPLYRWALEALLQGGCSPVYLAAPAHAVQALADEVGNEAVVVHGGATRQGSVASALGHVTTGVVVVHDAVRPLASASMVRAVIDEVRRGADGAIIARPLNDTLKRVRDGRVDMTVPRHQLWRAETPAAFRTRSLREAHTLATEQGWAATDDAELVERAGGSVRIVPAPGPNLKVTFPEDLDVVATLIAGPR